MEINNYQETIDPKLESRLRNVRKVVSGTGSLLGRTICYVQVDNLDLTHNEKEIRDIHPRLVKPLKKFMLNTITVTGTEIILIGDDVYIQFNGNPGLRAKAEEQDDGKLFANASDSAAIEEAIERAINGRAPLFFKDRKRLVQELNFRNQQEAEKADALANSFLEQANLLSDLIKAQDHDCEEYYKQYGLA